MLLTEWNWDDAKEVWQEEAFEAGEIKGRREGEIKGRKESILHSIKTLMNNMEITAEQAMDLLGISESERKQYDELLK